jgi:preprotein translocase subunit SecD
MIYQPAGSRQGSMMPMLGMEFVKEFIQALIAAWIVSLVAVATYFGRVGVVTAIGVSGTLMTNASYHIWYGFPTDYTLAAFTVDIVGAFVAGLAIAWWLGRARVISAT